MRPSYLVPLCILLSACTSNPTTTNIVEMHDRPISSVRHLAEEGDQEAMHDLCYRYIYGRHAKKDYAEARIWCGKSAEAGGDSSQVLLAEMYYNGHGMPVDFAQAVGWYEAAARQEHPHAWLMLYYMYKQGKGVEPDDAIAMTYLQAAVDAEYQPAIDELAKRNATN